MMDVGDDCLGVQNVTMDVRDDGVGVHNLVTNVGNGDGHAYCEFGLEVDGW